MGGGGQRCNMYMGDAPKNNQKGSGGNKGFGGGPKKPDGEFDWTKVIKTVFFFHYNPPFLKEGVMPGSE